MSKPIADPSVLSIKYSPVFHISASYQAAPQHHALPITTLMLTPRHLIHELQSGCQVQSVHSMHVRRLELSACVSFPYILYVPIY